MKEQLKAALIKSIVERAGANNAVLFSGGVDSTIVAKVLKDSNIEFKCYTAGFPEAEDVKFAEQAADALGLELEVVEIKNLKRVLKKIIDIIGTRDVIMVSVAVPIYVACSKIQEKTVFSSMGADELFAGYNEFRKLLSDYDAIDELCWQKLEQLQSRDLERDRKVAAHFGLELALPYLDPSVVTAGMKVPAEEKVSKEQNKIILRQIALELGVPDFVAERKKRAAQYGSGTMKQMKKLAKNKGHKYVKEFLEGI